MLAPLLEDDPPQLGGYRLLGRLGEGNQGVVYLGETRQGVRVAIKLLLVRAAADGGARERFVRELEAAKKVARFCTAQVLDAEVAGDRPYIVSEYVEGPSLRTRILADGPRGGGALERLAISTLTALAAIHKAGIVHRDFTPHNVLLGPDGPRVIDFGIARALDALPRDESVGTPAYMSPEQVAGKDIGPPADLFGWGATILFAATGRPPFGNESVPAVMDRVLHAEPDVGPLPEPLRSVVADCLAKDPARRPTADQAQARLLGDTPPVAARPRRSRLKVIVPVAAVAGLAAVAVAVPLWPHGGDAATRSGTPRPTATPDNAATLPRTEPAATSRVKRAHKTKKHSSSPAKHPPPAKGGCRDYTKPYGVPDRGTVVVRVTVCRDHFSGAVGTVDTNGKDGWDVCAQLAGHTAGTPTDKNGTYHSTPVFSSRQGGVHNYDVNPSSPRGEDWIVVHTGPCKPGAAPSWTYNDRLTTG